MTIAGRFVTPHYEIEVDTPPDAFITGLDLLVYYSGNEFNNGDKYDPIYRVALGTKHLVGKGDPQIYTQGGSFSATISGEVLTNKGVAMVVPSNKSVYFKLV
ncbi:hypothetical protein [Paenibacillus cookii]|uniref:DUF4183 domain-containing protein n=1 Tax=Paenibacillus cookii TaxID=157839 RepID=A0ABQ4M4M0_9BACL|nr:hypothetical protein [Paenibacillus cookii]GIO70436.1 hypothetical protein J21TS3_52570 [Paenibacillus cookii]